MRYREDADTYNKAQNDYEMKTLINRAVGTNYKILTNKFVLHTM